MAEFLFKDRVTSTPNRIKLIKVAEDTYDVEKIPGEIVEEGTPLNAATMNKLAQKTGLIRPNMLINSDFAINTRGKSVYNINNEPACDGWEVVKGGGAYYDATTKTLHCVAGGEYAWLLQRMPWIDITKLIGKTLTMSVRCKASRNKFINIGYYRGTSYKSLIQYSATVDSDFVTVTVSATIPDTVLATDILCPRIYCNTPSSAGTASLQLEWAKLEIGEYATEYQPPIEGEEFAKVKRYLDKANISTVMPLSSAAASNEKVLSEKVVYDEFAKISRIVYDKIIRTQAEFDALIADPTWFGATSVAFVGQFTYSVPNNSGIKIPATVKQIHGFNSAKITVTNFVYNSTTAKGGLWYDTAPTTPDYSIRDLEVDCTGDTGFGFSDCTNLTNCTGIGIGTWGFGFSDCTNLTNCIGTGTGTGIFGTGFSDCTNLTNCIGTGTGTGTGTNGYGFSQCTNLTNCTGKGTGTDGCGFSQCTNLTNCTGTGTGNRGYGFWTSTNLTNCTGKGTGDTTGLGFYSVDYASNCKDGGSSTAMWGGTNMNIDVDTCRKTPVGADNTTLNT